MIIDDEEYFEALYNQIQRDKIDSQEKKITIFCLNQDVDSLCSLYMLQVSRQPLPARWDAVPRGAGRPRPLGAADPGPLEGCARPPLPAEAAGQLACPPAARACGLRAPLPWRSHASAAPRPQTLLCKQSTYFTLVPVESYAAIQEKFSREFDLESTVSE